MSTATNAYEMLYQRHEELHARHERLLADIEQLAADWERAADATLRFDGRYKLALRKCAADLRERAKGGGR